MKNAWFASVNGEVEERLSTHSIKWYTAQQIYVPFYTVDQGVRMIWGAGLG